MLPLAYCAGGGQLIDRVCQESGADLSHNAAVNVCSCCVAASLIRAVLQLAQFAASMMNPNETSGPGITAASELMLCIGRSHMKPVVDQLLHNRKVKIPIAPPDTIVLKCLSELAVSSPGSLQQLEGFQLAHTQLLPLLQHARPEARNSELVYAFGGLAEGLMSGTAGSQRTDSVYAGSQRTGSVYAGSLTLKRIGRDD